MKKARTPAPILEPVRGRIIIFQNNPKYNFRFVTLFFFCPREGQQFPDAQVDLFFDGRQAILR